ncbi:MAG: NUDIX domain-containing protein [Patescibacteria group bacterium]
MPPKLFPAVKAFIFHEGKVLIVREAPGYTTGTQIGKYDVVGGRMEAGEHITDALRREAREEAGLDIEIGQPFFVNESWPVVNGEPHQIIRIFFRCHAKTATVRLGTDHDHYQWIHPADYRLYPIIENLYPAFELLNQS